MDFGVVGQLLRRRGKVHYLVVLFLNNFGVVIVRQLAILLQKLKLAELTHVAVDSLQGNQDFVFLVLN